MTIAVNPISLQRQTLNPYRAAARLLWDRLKWDASLSSWASRAELKKIRGSHAGEKAVILCNGPSLLKTDLSLLRDVYTFGLNKINLLFSTSDFRPSCIVAINRLVIEQNAKFYGKTSIPLFIDSRGIGFVKKRAGVTFLHSAAIPRFVPDCSISVYQGYTVTYVALQLAFHMGFSKVALVGCDHNFAVAGPANMTVISGAQDHSHFDPNYFAGGVKWQLPDLFQSELSYQLARNHYETNGRGVFNCTVGGKLEIFERQTLECFLAT